MKSILSLLVRLYPAPFREEFGAEVVEQASMDYECARTRGPLAALWFWVATVTDLIGSALAEHLRPTWGSERKPTRGGEGSMFSRGWDGGGILRSFWTGARALLRAPAFTWTTVILMGLGVGSVTTVFTVVDHLFLRPLPYPHAERMIRVNSSQSHPSLRDLESMRSVEAWAAASNEDVNLIATDVPLQLRQARVTEGFFQFFGARAALGRLLDPTDFRSDDVALLSHDTWETVFGGDPDIVGLTVRIDGSSVVIAGVLDRSFVAPEGILDGSGADVWRPVDTGHPDFEVRDWHVLVAVGRLAEGATIAQVRQEAAEVAQRRAAAFPNNYVRSDGSIVDLPIESLHEATVGSARDGLGLLVAMVTLLALIACANVAHLFMARGISRSGEIAVRRALGGGTGRIAGQLVIESLLLAGAGTILGIGLASLGLDAFVRLSPDVLPRAGELTLDGRVVGFAVALSTSIALLFGLLPMVRAAGTSPSDAMRAGTRGTTHERLTPGLRGGLVVAEVALSVVLVAGAGLLIHSFARLRDQPLGFTVENVWTIPVRVSGDESAAEWRVRMDRIADAIRATPGTRAVTYGLSAPLEHIGGDCCWSRLVRRPDAEQGVTALAHPFGGDYFEVFGPRLVAGRAWTAVEAAGPPSSAVLNEPLAVELFGSAEAAVGQDVMLRAVLHQVVGVIAEDRHYGMLQRHGAAVYVPITSLTFVNDEATFAVRTRDAGNDVTRRLQEAVWAVEPELALPVVRPMSDWATRATARPRFDAWIVTAFGVVALVLAAAGLYGTLLYMVMRERRDLAIRLSLGAKARDLETLVLRRGLATSGAGIVIGSVGAWAAGRLLQSRLPGLGSADPTTMIVVIVVLLLTTILASWIPARRAGAMNPLEILRQQ